MSEISKPTTAEKAVIDTLHAMVDLLGGMESKMVDLGEAISDQSSDIAILANRISALESGLPEEVGQDEELEPEVIEDESEVENEVPAAVRKQPKPLPRLPRVGTNTHLILAKILTEPGPWNSTRVMETLQGMGVVFNTTEPRATAGNILYRLHEAGFLQKSVRGSYSLRRSVREQIEDARKAIIG